MKNSLEYKQMLVRMGKGQYKTMKHVPTSSWKGTDRVAVPFDKEQAEENIRLGLGG